MPTGIPTSEKIVTTYTTLKGDIYYITEKKNVEDYFLYKDENGKAVKIAKGPTPLFLEEKYIKGNKNEQRK